MGILRIYPKKNNTIASGIYSNYNSGQNAVTDLWYGGGTAGTSTKLRQSTSRFLVKFDLEYLQGKISDLEINSGLTITYKLKMKNSIPRDRILEPEFEFNKLNKIISASYDLICFPINKDWDEGRGYDLSEEQFLVKQTGNPMVTGYSNWDSATRIEDWDEPGVFTDPEYYYSGSTFYKDLKFEQSYVDSIQTYSLTILSGDLTNNTVSAYTDNNDIFVSFSGSATVADMKLALESSTFSGYGMTLSLTGSGLANIVSGETFTSGQFFTTNTPVNRFEYDLPTQHFDIGDEDIDMDISTMVNYWLSGGSINNGIGVAYTNPYEIMSTDTRSVASFYTSKTNSAFKPYIEVSYNQIIQDDRKNITNNRTSRLFLYTFSGNNAVSYFSASTVQIQQSNGTVVLGKENIIPTQLEKGVYYIDILMDSATPGQKYKDVWSGVTFVPGIDVQNITQDFQIQKNYYTEKIPSINDYVMSTYGIGNNSILTNEEVVKVFCDLRINYSNNPPITSYNLQYRMIQNSQLEVIPWTSVNQTILNNCSLNYFNLDTSWLLHNQTYEIEFKITEMGSHRILPEKITFKIMRPF